MVNKHLTKICRCTEIQSCLEGDLDHPCGKIVISQNVRSVEKFQVPEPWSGRIKTAPILFISSNPSIADDEPFPRGHWNDMDIVDFFQNRFGGGEKHWIINGTKSLREDGSYGRATMFWAGVKGRARELLEREPIPGVDYALTELVHCKSRQELGVAEALEICVALYLKKVISVSGARILVGLGSLAKEVLSQELSLPQEKNVIPPIVIEGRQRMISFLPHPNAWKDKTFEKVLSTEELSKIREFLDTHGG